MSQLEISIIDIAGLQTGESEVSEAVSNVDLDEVRQKIDAVVSSEDMTVEERVEALEAIRDSLYEAAPELERETEGDAELEALQARLTAAEEGLEQLNGELAEQQETIETLTAQIDEMSTQAETDATQLEALQAQLTEAQAEADAKTEELTAAQAAYEQYVAELEAYRVQREPASGEAHVSTSVGNVIEIADDGVTATWDYVNRDISGNAVTLSLVLDGETLYTSGALKPGEVIDSIQLGKPLEAGTYRAMAVTTVYDANGEVQLTNRVPVTLNVAG